MARPNSAVDVSFRGLQVVEVVQPSGRPLATSARRRVNLVAAPFSAWLFSSRRADERIEG